MSVVVGAAMSLLKLQSTPPLPQAVIAAVASGLTLSCRNVLQRKHHHQHSSSASGNATGTSSKNVTSTSPPDAPTSTSATAAVQSVSLSDLTKLEKSVLQFTQLSFYSGLWMGVMSLLLWLVIMAPESNESIEETTSSTTRTTPTQVFLWHPLYNVFSMITLGFCSALTHSLLNAGKRVFAICMAMVWFREGFNSKTMAGLLLVGVGGAWYSTESKGAKNAANFSMTNTNNNRRGSRPLLLQLVTEKDNNVRPAVKLATAAILLASLFRIHAVGSLATNVGFMYGKASVIQVIKLLEPFETLLLSQLLFQEGNCSIGIVASMSVVVGAAMSLLKLQSTTPLPQAVIAAVASGLTLSCRNVLQRKHHHQHSSSASGNATGTLSKNVTSTSPQDPPTSSSATAAVQSVSLSDLTKLEKSVLQFTQLSFYSGLWTGVISLVLWLVIMAPEGNESIEETTSSTTRTTPTQVFLWHPLYNVFSMITLGFCSALTHSLLNAGKRVFAICMAMVWFREGFNSKTMAGLLLVGVGGVWYSSESKGAKNAANFSMTNTNNNRRGSRPLLLQLVTEKDNTLRPAVKLATAAILLASLLQFQSN
eukprot:CAMPEP_0113493214 /NCGR_PEP_ID=MMETSP0014_2-20120614/28477_1 /TAXON_ID=2857 /ORGANISM="Nitzschia sp." /LENGTH=592 /DNA_ID=CAMNT_0000387071 /DNA_START=164 /DNA_END=1943 /DNA_ORIENTATION=- /assembly_acc=CAM_ASM_000159